MITVSLFHHSSETALQLAAKIEEDPGMKVMAVTYCLHDVIKAFQSGAGASDVSIINVESMEDSARMRSKFMRAEFARTKRFFVTNRLTVGDVVRGVHTGFDNFLLYGDSIGKWRETIDETMSGRQSLRNNPLWNVAGLPFDMTKVMMDDRPGVDRDIIELVAEGLTNDQIAGVLNLSSQTVRNKISRVMDDVGINNRTLLSLVFMRSHVAWRTEPDGDGNSQSLRATP